MNIILSIETSTPTCSIALHEDNKLLGKMSIQKGQSHSSILNQAIQNLLDLAELSFKDLSTVAISKGPGSYTGLRIGTSTAKGLCYSLDIPLISVDTLMAMALGIDNVSGYLLCPMLDARRMEVYASVFNPSLEVMSPTSPEILDGNSFFNFLDKENVIFFGNGSTKFKQVVNHPNAYFIDFIEPDAEYVGQLAVQKYENKVFEDVAYFEPFYLKDFRATKPKSIL